MKHREILLHRLFGFISIQHFVQIKGEHEIAFNRAPGKQWVGLENVSDTVFFFPPSDCILMLPDLGLSNPAIRFKTVVLPHPLAPRIQTISPFLTLSSKALTVFSV